MGSRGLEERFENLEKWRCCDGFEEICLNLIYPNPEDKTQITIAGFLL
jgi:hypothetical protein